MKKILLFHHYGALGGAGVSLLHIVQAIDKSKIKLTVLCPDYPEDIANLLQAEDCEVIRSGTSPKVFNHCIGGIPYALSFATAKNIYEIVKDRKFIRKYISDVKPDIVAVNSMTLFIIGKIAKSMGKRTVCLHRETYQRGLLGLRTKIIKKGLSSWFDKVAFVSSNDFNETGNSKAKKVVIYDRVNLALFDNFKKTEARQMLGLKEDKKYILYLGGMSALKGADIIMKSMKYVDRADVILIFIGDSDQVQEPSWSHSKNAKEKLKFVLKKGIRMRTLNMYFKAGLQDRVIFRKVTTNPELYYNACDLIVFPSTKPHQARPIYEAGVAKIPIIITDFCQTKEFVEDGITGITFRNKDSHELAKKINMVFDGKFDLEKIVQNNYIQTVRNHDLATLKVDLDNLFEFDGI